MTSGENEAPLLGHTECGVFETFSRDVADAASR